MTTDEFVLKYDGKAIDWDGAFGNQCVDLYRQYCHEVLCLQQSPPVEGAYQIWDTYLKDKFIKIENTPEGIPVKGDIMIWSKSSYRPYGHVSVFLEGNVNNFTSFDQNSPVGSLCHKQGHTYSGVQGWLRPKGVCISDTQEIDQLKKRITELENEVKYKNEQISNYVKQVDEITIELNEVREARNRDRELLAERLKCTKEMPVILSEIEKLFVAEEGLQVCIDNKARCEEKYTQKAAECTKIYETLTLLSGYTVASPNGVERALNAYARLHDKNLPLDSYTALQLIGNLIGRIKWPKKE